MSDRFFDSFNRALFALGQKGFASKAECEVHFSKPDNGLVFCEAFSLMRFCAEIFKRSLSRSEIFVSCIENTTPFADVGLFRYGACCFGERILISTARGLMQGVCADSQQEFDLACDYALESSVLGAALKSRGVSVAVMPKAVIVAGYAALCLCCDMRGFHVCCENQLCYEGALLAKRLGADIREIFLGGKSSYRALYEKRGQLCSVAAYSSVLDYEERAAGESALVICTRDPFYECDIILGELGEKTSGSYEIMLNRLQKATAAAVSGELVGALRLPIVNTAVCQKDEIAAVLADYVLKLHF